MNARTAITTLLAIALLTACDLTETRACFQTSGSSPTCMSLVSDDVWVMTTERCVLEPRIDNWPIVAGWETGCGAGTTPEVPPGFDSVECRRGPRGVACWAWQGDLAVTLEQPCRKRDGMPPGCAPELDDVLTCSGGVCWSLIDNAWIRVAPYCAMQWTAEVPVPSCE